MSQDARRVDPSVVPGTKPAGFPGFIEPCHPTLREEAPSGGRWVHEIKFDGYPSPVGRARMPLVLKLLIEDPPIELTARFIRW